MPAVAKYGPTALMPGASVDEPGADTKLLHFYGLNTWGDDPILSYKRPFSTSAEGLASTGHKRHLREVGFERLGRSAELERFLPFLSPAAFIAYEAAGPTIVARLWRAPVHNSETLNRRASNLSTHS